MPENQGPTAPVAPYLTVSAASAAIEFYKKAFGAVEVSRMPMPEGGKLMHAAITVNGGLIMLSDDFPEYNDGKSNTPEKFGGSPVTIHLELPDVDAVWKQAIDAGATIAMPLEDQFWGARFGQLTDPFGHSWSLATTTSNPTEGEMRAAMGRTSGD